MGPLGRADLYCVRLFTANGKEVTVQWNGLVDDAIVADGGRWIDGRYVFRYVRRGWASLPGTARSETPQQK